MSFPTQTEHLTSVYMGSHCGRVGQETHYNHLSNVTSVEESLLRSRGLSAGKQQHGHPGTLRQSVICMHKTTP